MVNNLPPHAYKALKCWHETSGSMPYYIEALQAKASQEGQPEDVLYRQENGVWPRLEHLNEDHPFRETFATWLLQQK